MRRLVVIGDSTAFTVEDGPAIPGDGRSYPEVAAARLAEATGEEWHATVIARPGTTVREALRTVLKDRHVQWDVLLGADAVVVGVGSFDHAPGGTPPAIEALVPYLRPPALRRRARRAAAALYPRIVVATRGRLRRTPAAEFARAYADLLLQVRSWTQGAPGVVVGPTSHRSAYYGHRHPLHAQAQAEQFALAEGQGFATVAAWPFVLDHLEALNPDGIHWPSVVHEAVGCRVAELLVAQFRGELSTPRSPLDDLDVTGS